MTSVTITPTDLTTYTSFASVKSRTSDQLSKDIIEATAFIRKKIGHAFEDNVLYPTLPEDAKTAFLKVAQFYAVVNSDENRMKGIQSEHIGDYTYSLAQSGAKIPDVMPLLKPYIQQSAGTVRMRMRIL